MGRISSFRVELVRLAFAGLLLFTFGHFIFYAILAQAAGSWKYLIYEADEYSYWTYAKGAASTPTCESNPFYFEERGRRHTVPYTTASLIGLAAKSLNVPVLSFFSIFHIGMPFLVWLTFLLCFHKLWGYALRPSAAMAMIFLLCVLYLHGAYPATLLRFSRPSDGLWLLCLWLSAVMLKKPEHKYSFAGIGLAILACTWVNPFLALVGGMVSFLEAAWQLTFHKNRKHLFFSLGILVFVVLAAATYYGYIRWNMSQNPWVFELLKESGIAPEKRRFDIPSLIFYGMLFTGILAIKSLTKERLSPLDRLLLFFFLLEPIFGNIQFFLGGNFQFAPKRQYFFILQLACLTGWLLEKTPALLRQPAWQKWEKAFIAVLCALMVFVFSNGWYNFLIYGPHTERLYALENNSRTLLTIFPCLFLGVWFYKRFEKFKKILQNAFFVYALIALFAIGGYAGYSVHSRGDLDEIGRSRHTVFDKAYEWINQNAEVNSVVLTVPPSHLTKDYLILYTDMKTYINPFGEVLARSKANPDNAYRFEFYSHLLLGDLPETPLENRHDMKEKLTHLKLDYVLIDRPSPFLDMIAKQLGSHLVEVYRDETCLLWKVKT